MAKNLPRTYGNLVWAEVRRRYLAGDSAPKLCAEFSLARSTFVDRARKGKWRRMDIRTLDDTPVAAPTDPRSAALEAIARAALAASAGDLAKANQAARLAERLVKTAALLARNGVLDLPCPHCGAAPSDTREDRARHDQEVWREITGQLDRLRAQAIANGEIEPDDGEFDWFADDDE